MEGKGAVDGGIHIRAVVRMAAMVPIGMDF